MTNTTIITALPIGEFDADVIRSEFESIIGVFNGSGIDLFVADPLSKGNPDLLFLIPLRGLSAQIIETAVLASHSPCLIYPVQGRFALPSSTLAVGALQESRIPTEVLYAPPDHPDFIKRLRCTIRAARAFSRIQRSRIAVIGSLFPNLVSCRYDPQIVSSR